ATCAVLRSQAPVSAPEKATDVVHGRVVDELGRPLAGAAVCVLTAGEGFDTAKLLAEPPVKTAADGSYRIPAPGKFLSVAAITEGRTACVAGVPFYRQADTPMPDLLLMPGAVLTGRVLEATGKPVAGARIL